MTIVMRRLAMTKRIIADIDQAIEEHELRMYEAKRDVGLTWIEILAWLDDPRNHADRKRQNVRQWIKANLPLRNRHNLPYTQKWMNEFAKFARRWLEFMDAWNWAERKGTRPIDSPACPPRTI